MSQSFCAVFAAEEIRITGSSFKETGDQQARLESAKVFLGDFVITADEIFSDNQKQIMQLRGNIGIHHPDYTILAERLEVDLKNSSFNGLNVSIVDFQNGVYLRAKSMEYLSPSLTLSEVTLTDCNFEDPYWEFYLEKAVFHKDNYGYGLNMLFYLHGVPLAYFPALAGSIRGKRHSGFLSPKLSYDSSGPLSERNGLRLRLPYFINLNRDHDLTVTPDYLSNRGLGTNLEYNYAFRQGMRGKLNLYLLDENNLSRKPEDEEGMGNNDDPKPLRHATSFDHRHSLKFNPSLQYSYYINAEKNSDNRVREDYLDASSANDAETFLNFSNEIRFGSHYASAYAERGRNFSVSSRYDQSTDEDTILLRQPSASAVFTKRITPWLNVSGQTKLDQFSRKKGWKGQRAMARLDLGDVYYWGGLRVEPSLRFHARNYSIDYAPTDTIEASSDFSSKKRFSAHYREVRLKFSQTYFLVKNSGQFAERFSLIPFLGFRQLGDFDQREALGVSPQNHSLTELSQDYETHSPVFDDDDLVTAYRFLNLGLEFKVERKTDFSKTPRKIFSLKLNQNYDLLSGDSSADDEKKLKGPIIQESLRQTPYGERLMPWTLEMFFSPLQNLELNSFLRFAQAGNLLESRHSLEYAEENGNSLNVSRRNNTKNYKDLLGNLHLKTRQVRVSGQYYLNDVFSISSFLVWDDLRETASLSNKIDRKLSSAGIGFRHLNCCYTWGLGYSEKISEQTVNGVESEYVSRTWQLSFGLLNKTVQYSGNLSNG